MFYVYAIWNKVKDKIYIGHTANLEERLKRHNQLLPNKTKSFTSKNKGLWMLARQEEFKTRKEAIMREKALKSYQGRKFIKNVIKSDDEDSGAPIA